MTRLDERAFEALRRDAEEARRVRRRAATLLGRRRARAHWGLRDLVRRVLPQDAEGLTRLARILRFPSGDLDDLRRGDIDPTTLPLEPLVALGQLLGLTVRGFLALVAQDHRRLGDRILARDAPTSLSPRVSEPGASADARSRPRGDLVRWHELIAAWDRASLDLPDNP